MDEEDYELPDYIDEDYSEYPDDYDDHPDSDSYDYHGGWDYYV